jgi:redox-sensitive bicupin YhaK (pirin superfamily)
MMRNKTIKALHGAIRDDIGDLVTRRPLPGPRVAQIDPFLLLNHHGPQTYPPHNHGLPFGPHPHRGFETVTFIRAGELAHRDSGGHESVIRAGGVQWMTAGRGLIHAEVSPEPFMRSGGPLEILQLWVNLPAGLKMTEPRYIGLQREQIPALTTADARGTVHLIAGEWNGRRGPIPSLTGVFMSTVELATNGRITLTGVEHRNVFLYVVRGSVRIADGEAGTCTLVELGRAGDTLELTASSDASLLLGHAAPIGEPVVAHGPFVMNTREQIQQAIRDYHAGAFGPALD